MAIVTDSSQRTDPEPSIDPLRLAYALAIRGRSWGHLATRKGGPLGVNTVTRLRHRERVDASTLIALAAWLERTPVDPNLVAVIAKPAPPEATS